MTVAIVLAVVIVGLIGFGFVMGLRRGKRG